MEEFTGKSVDAGVLIGDLPKVEEWFNNDLNVYALEEKIIFPSFSNSKAMQRNTSAQIASDSFQNQSI